MTSLKLQPCLLKKSLKTQNKLKQKFADFHSKNADVSITQGVCHVSYIFFGSSLGKV